MHIWPLIRSGRVKELKKVDDTIIFYFFFLLPVLEKRPASRRLTPSVLEVREQPLQCGVYSKSTT